MFVNIHAASATQRRNEIVSLVRHRPVRSQDELQRLLASRGIAVTQPTLSRDLKELALVKSPAGYALPGAAAPAANGGVDKVERLLREFGLSVDAAGTLVVVKTPPGAANAVALALDQASLEGVAGTIAGDDTIFLATRSAASAVRLARGLSRPLPPSPPARPRRRA
jgi:transcriptional regulator of arginine metabolism